MKGILVAATACQLRAQAVQSHMCLLLSTHRAVELNMRLQVCCMFKYYNIRTLSQ